MVSGVFLFFVQHSFIWKALRKFKAPKLFFWRKSNISQDLLISAELFGTNQRKLKTAKSNLLCAKLFQNFFFPPLRSSLCTRFWWATHDNVSVPCLESHPFLMVPVNENYPSSPKAELGDFEVTKKTDSKQRWVVWVVCSLVSKRNTPFGILDFGGGHRIYIYIYDNIC